MAYRRRTDDYSRRRSRSREGRHSPRKRSGSPGQRHRDDREEVESHRHHKRRRSENWAGNMRDSREYRDREAEEQDSRRRRSRDREDNKRSRRRSSSPDMLRQRDLHKARARSRSPRKHRQRPLSASRSPPPKSCRSNAPLPSQQDAFTSTSLSDKTVGRPIEKQKPNYNTSGKLAAETNTVAGTDIILKYNEPPEGRNPSASHPWRMYEFKGENPEPLSTTELHTRSCWLFGRERAVVDFAIEHPSCSKQHAVIQFRYVEKKNEFGDRLGGVKPYVIDLESANGTRLNGERIPDKRFWEIKSGDMIGFGESTREYVIMLPPKE